MKPGLGAVRRCVRSSGPGCSRPASRAVQQLAVRRGQLPVRHGMLVLHVARLLATQPAGARATGPQRLFVWAHARTAATSGARAAGAAACGWWEDDEELPRLVARQRVGQAHPRFGSELLGIVGHRGLPVRHAGDQKRYVEAPRQVAVGDPVRQQWTSPPPASAARGALNPPTNGAWRSSAATSFQARRRAVGTRQQHPNSLEAFADGGDGLGQGAWLCVRSACRLTVGGGVLGVDTAAPKHVGAGAKLAFSERRVISTSMPAGVSRSNTGGGGAGGRAGSHCGCRSWLGRGMRPLSARGAVR